MIIVETMSLLSLSDIFGMSVTFILYIVMASSLLSLTKKVRARRGALSSVLNFKDIQILMLSSIAVSFALAAVPWLAVKALICISFFLYGVLIWLDALLFVQYRIEINRQSMAWFFTGSKGLAKGIPHLFLLLKQVPWIVFIPLMWAATQGVVLYLQSLPSTSFSSETAFSVSLFAGLMMVAMILLYVWQLMNRPNHQFFTAPSLLLNIVLDDTFAGNEDLVLDPRHQPFVEPKMHNGFTSEITGVCEGANIILITIESLGNYLENEVSEGIQSKLRERFREHTWIGKKHFCLCPNTTVSTNQIYTGAYSNNPYNKLDSLYPGAEPKHLKTLKQRGYTTMFLDSADIELYDYYKLLDRIGFDHVWGTNDMHGNERKADYRLWNMVDAVADAADGGPFFLHIINDQSHMPYETVDNKRFNRHKGKDAKSQYMNAVEEVDYIIDEFLNRLADKVDMSNTLLVFTGDHGESFGEYGYSFHSNSIIYPQMHVPFFLTHPRLTSKEIEHSCHFDLFPTFFDLLGISTDYPHLGTTLADDSRAFAYLFHSATLKGNTPANFGFLFNDELFWVDRLFNQIKRVQDGKCSSITLDEEREYICSLLQRMLKQRAIMQ